MSAEQKTESPYKAMRLAEKWKAAKFDAQERHKKLMTIINLVSLVVTLGLAYYTYWQISQGFDNCPGAWVSTTLYFVLVMHATNILQVTMELTGCGGFCCSGIQNLCLDLFEIAVLMLMMYETLFSTHCYAEGPDGARGPYVCLLVNNIIYWTFFSIFTFFTIRSFCCDMKTEEELKKELNEEEKTVANKVE